MDNTYSQHILSIIFLLNCFSIMRPGPVYQVRPDSDVPHAASQAGPQRVSKQDPYSAVQQFR